jgi:molybdate transport system substrate-binding protein
MSRLLSSSLCLTILVLLPFSSVAQTTLTVAAAADLIRLEPGLVGSFRKIAPQVRLRFVNEASAVISQQIQNGAPYDVFLSANAQYVDRLASNRKLVPDSVMIYAVGRVGVLWKDGKHHDIKDLTQNWVRFVALPNPKLAPYGVAAEQALQHAGIWPRIHPKIVYGENVEQALQMFESGNADAVLTSASLLQGKNPELIPVDWHQPITQKAGIVAGTKNQDAARAFLVFLRSQSGQAVFKQFCFSSPKPLVE